MYLKNSVIVVGVSVVLILIVSAMSSYILARMKFFGSTFILGLIIAGMAIPIHVTLIPVYLMSSSLGLYDKLTALIGPYVAFSIPMSIFILCDFMRSIPKEMEEAARIDGCSYKSTFFRVIFPLCKPGLVTLAIYNAVMLWNEFLFALVLTQSPSKHVLPLGIWEYQGAHYSNIPMIMTFLVLCTLPMILAYIFGQEKLIQGMVAGAVKG
jgi:raffinose/stachyose/melibiose transport system permease protein